MTVYAQRNVTDAQPHASFGSGPLFPSPLEDVVDLTDEQASEPPNVLTLVCRPTPLHVLAAASACVVTVKMTHVAQA